MRTATMSVWPLVVAFTHVFAHDYAHGHAEQSVMPKLRKGEQWAVLLRKQLKALRQDRLLSKTKTGNSDLFSYRGG